MEPDIILFSNYKRRIFHARLRTRRLAFGKGAAACPSCGNSKIRPAKKNNPVFLSTLEGISAGMLENLLEENGIPFFKNRSRTYRQMMPQAYDRCDYYIPLGALNRARELLSLTRAGA